MKRFVLFLVVLALASSASAGVFNRGCEPSACDPVEVCAPVETCAAVDECCVRPVRRAIARIRACAPVCDECSACEPVEVCEPVEPCKPVRRIPVKRVRRVRACVLEVVPVVECCVRRTVRTVITSVHCRRCGCCVGEAQVQPEPELTEEATPTPADPPAPTPAS